jgi:hypothetical protein
LALLSDKASSTLVAEMSQPVCRAGQVAGMPAQLWAWPCSVNSGIGTHLRIAHAWRSSTFDRLLDIFRAYYVNKYIGRRAYEIAY